MAARPGRRFWHWRRGRTPEIPLGYLSDPGRTTIAGHGSRRGVWQGFGVRDGLSSSIITSTSRDREGVLWFGTWGGGACRYDGEGFTSFTTRGGLTSDTVAGMTEDRSGQVWCGTWGGLSRYDGERFVNFTTAHGLAHNVVTAILQDREGYLWFATWGGGVTCYDGQVFQLLCRQDGLAHDTVRDIIQDRRGDFWIATEGGLTRYRPQRLPPAIRLAEVITTHRHGPVAEVEFSVSHRFLAFEFQGRSWTTHPDRMAYVYRLLGHQDEWQVTYRWRVEYEDLELGEYLFEVKAVDRDLNYSAEAVQVRVRVVPAPGAPPRSWASRNLLCATA